ncbi:MAG: hypothetical protein ACI4GO_04060 [Hominenteromicrobium sp.]
MKTIVRPLKQSVQAARSVCAAAALFALCALLIAYRTDAASGILTGIYTCLNTLVPALFPFVLLACITAKSAAADLLFRPLAPVMRHAFRLPSCAAPALVFGLTAGYPTGAKIAAQLYGDGRLSRAEAARLLCFCTSPGYAFAAAYTGAVMLGSTHTGMLLFLACLIAPLLTGLCLARFVEKPAQPEKPSPRNAGGVTRAVQDGVSAMAAMCGFVVAFSSLLAVLHGSGLFQGLAGLLSRLGMTVPTAGAVLSFLLEVTSGVIHSAYWHTAPALIAFGLGFGGLCIHLQIFSFFRSAGFPMKKMLYLLSRLANGVTAAACYRVLAHFFPASEAAASLSGRALSAAPTASGAAASAALLALSVFFLLSCTEKGRPPKTGRRP